MSARNSKKSTTSAESPSGTPTETKTSQLIDYVELLATLNEPQEDTNSTLTESVDPKLEGVSAIVKAQLDRFLDAMDEKLAEFLQGLEQSLVGSPNSNVSTPADDLLDDSAEAMEDSESEDSESEDCDVSEMLSEWDRRKMQMLAELGEPQSESLTVGTPSTDSNPVTEEVDDREPPRLGDAQEDHELDALHDTIASLGSVDAEEIDALKQKLTEKLRDAEVELSINRASLAQQWAVLERKQHEMTQRETTLNSKYGNLTEANKKSGLLGRFSRHLSRDSD